jgi:hypothetical protein
MRMFTGVVINDDSKVLIANSMGRSGTTLLQKMLCKRHGLRNLNELITYDDTRADTIASLAGSKGWVCKFFVEVDTANRFDHRREIADISPSIIYNAYREDKLDQFLSFQLSLLNDKWNADTRLEYRPVSIDDPAGSIGYFLRSLDIYSTLLSHLREEYEVVDISYEQIISSDLGSTDHGVAKQNSFEQKLHLVENIDQVLAEWERLVT